MSDTSSIDTLWRPHSQSPPQQKLDVLLNQSYYDAFDRPDYYSEDTSCHIFDFSGTDGIFRSDLNDKEVHEIIEEERFASYDFRIIFIDSILKDKRKLFITSKCLRTIFDTYNISPRFAGLINRQQMPGSATHFEEDTSKPRSHELWYSAVIRSQLVHGDETACDLSRKVLDWRRFSLWSKYDISNKRTNVLVMGCPAAIRQDFAKTFSENNAVQLQRHPMLVHVFFAKGILLWTYDFLYNFSGFLYEWEFKGRDLRSTEDYTRRVQAFLALSRQIQQLTTDYDIFDATLEHIREQHNWFESSIIRLSLNPTTDSLSPGNPSLETESRTSLLETLDSLLRDAKLCRTYSRLFNDRAKIGVSEGFAMVNQRDAEVNVMMAAESTQIARAAHLDSRTLRFIQLLTVLFLPVSLVSSIFGMGFFSMSKGEDGRASLVVSSNWWLFVAVSVPFTVVCLIFLGGCSIVQRKNGDRRLSVAVVDLENGRRKSDGVGFGQVVIGEKVDRKQ